jgi:hypothetical protein
MSMLNQLVGIEGNYKVSSLKEALKMHLDNHRTDYVIALNVYHSDIKDALKRITKFVNTEEIIKMEVHHNFGLHKPVDITESYENILNILDHLKEDYIQLSFSEANHILNNSWDWATSAKLSNSFYSKRL